MFVYLFKETITYMMGTPIFDSQVKVLKHCFLLYCVCNIKTTGTTSGVID